MYMKIIYYAPAEVPLTAIKMEPSTIEHSSKSLSRLQGRGWTWILDRYCPAGARSLIFPWAKFNQ